MTDRTPTIGQEAICPDGLGRVVDFGTDYIRVSTYVDDHRRVWSWDDVTLVPIGGAPATREPEAERMRAALREVEDWWLEDGQHKFDGAPACIFTVREVLASDKKDHDP